MQLKDATRAKQVIAEIVRCAGGELTGKLKLFKAFYFAHLFYAENAPDYLTNWPIVKMPNGPGIDSGDVLLTELVRARVLKRDAATVGPYHATKYRTGEASVPGEGLSATAIESIRKAVELVQTMSATELSEATHEYSRSWNEAKEGQRLNIYIDHIPDEEFERRQVDLDILDRELNVAWKSES
jgi:uncharacterized phage-associated protein